MNAIYYRWAVIKTGGGTGANSVLVAGGYKKADDAAGGGTRLAPTAIKSLNTAISQAMAFNRRFQSGSQDARVEVFGQIFDTNNAADALLSGLPDDNRPRPANRVRELQISGTPPLEEAREQVYARVDTPDHDLLKVVHLSNRATGEGGLLQANLDTSEDTEDTTIA